MARRSRAFAALALAIALAIKSLFESAPLERSQGAARRHVRRPVRAVAFSGYWPVQAVLCGAQMPLPSPDWHLG